MNLIEFDFCVPAGHPSLPGHFPQHPIVPGVLLLDHVLSNLQRVTGRQVMALRQVKFLAALQPQESAHARCEAVSDNVSDTVSFRVTAARGGLAVTLATGQLALRRCAEPDT